MPVGLDHADLLNGFVGELVHLLHPARPEAELGQAVDTSNLAGFPPQHLARLDQHPVGPEAGLLLGLPCVRQILWPLRYLDQGELQAILQSAAEPVLGEHLQVTSLRIHVGQQVGDLLRHVIADHDRLRKHSPHHGADRFLERGVQRRQLQPRFIVLSRLELPLGQIRLPASRMAEVPPLMQSISFQCSRISSTAAQHWQTESLMVRTSGW